MRFEKLVINGSQIQSQEEIDKLLDKLGFYWLIDSEIENASIEIKNNTLIWYSGTFYSGRWYYGIWKSGSFFGIWENGIFENGEFHGDFKSGIMPQNPKK